MSQSQVFATIQTLLTSRMLPNCCQCTYEHNLGVAIRLVKQMHEDNLRVIEQTEKLLQSVKA